MNKLVWTVVCLGICLSWPAGLFGWQSAPDRNRQLEASSKGEDPVNLPRQRGDTAFSRNVQQKQKSRAAIPGGGNRGATTLANRAPAPAPSASQSPTQLPGFSGGPVPTQSASATLQYSPGQAYRFSDSSPMLQEGLPEAAPGLPGGSDSAPLSTGSADAAQESEESSEEEDGGDAAAEGQETFFRPEFHEWGPLTIESVYTGEVFSKAHGGLTPDAATRYRGNLDLTFLLDMEQANLWAGGEIFVYFHQAHGTTLTPDFIGDGQYYSNIDTGPRPQTLSRLGEYWYRHTSLDEALALKFGRQDANADFAYCELGGDFLNSSFVTLPNLPMPFWPFQSLGASGLYQVNERWRVGSGVYDHSHNQAQWWSNPSDQGLFMIWQADWSPFADLPDAPLTVLKFGSWHSTADTLSIDEVDTFDGNYGFYTTLDRMLLPELGAADQGLGGFFQFSWAPGDRNQVDRAYAAGLVYRGLLVGRDADTCGIAYTGIRFSNQLQVFTGQTSEDVFEVFYKARLRRGISWQPDLQYIARPNGLERDALVAGVRFECSF